MTHIGYVAAGWIIPLAVLGSYAVWMLRRARKLAERVPPHERRWSA